MCPESPKIIFCLAPKRGSALHLPAGGLGRAQILKLPSESLVQGMLKAAQPLVPSLPLPHSLGAESSPASCPLPSPPSPPWVLKAAQPLVSFPPLPSLTSVGAESSPASGLLPSPPSPPWVERLALPPRWMQSTSLIKSRMPVIFKGTIILP